MGGHILKGSYCGLLVKALHGLISSYQALVIRHYVALATDSIIK